jgi:hypothetical protein
MSQSLTESELLTVALKLADGPVTGAKLGLLLRQVDTAFEPQRYGHRNLRAFLAANTDVVQVTRAEFDIMVRLADAPQPASATGHDVDLQPVRQDLWSAFTFVSASLSRFYDRESDRVITFPQEPSGDEPKAVAEMRAAVAAAPERHVRITPLSSGEHRAAAGTFIAGLPNDDTRRAELDAALGASMWFKEFTGVLRRYADLNVRWRRHRSAIVVARIRAWMAEAHLDIRDAFAVARPRRLHVVERRLDPDDETPRKNANAEIIGSNQIREQLLRAVAEMSTAELLRLPIPAEYVLRALGK